MRPLSLVLTVAAASLGCLPALAQEAVCALDGGVPVAEVEAVNALVREARFDDLAAALAATITGLAPEAFDGLKSAYPGPFSHCTTLVQRVDVGGLTQHVVVFEGDNPLFVYWAAATFQGKTGVVSFNMDSTFGPVLEMLK